MDENELKEIDAAIDASAAAEDQGQGQGEDQGNGNGEDVAQTAEGEAVNDEADGESGSHENEGGGDGEKPQPYCPDDATIERGVRAGLSLKDIMSIGSNEAMEAILDKLGATAPKSEENNEAGGDDDISAADGDPFADVDLDEIDENIVKAMKAMSAQNAAMRKEIETLKKAGESARAQDRFSQLVGTLDESVQKGMDAATRSHLKKQFDILSAGYKATGTEKKDADIFAEAAKLAIGDRMTESAERKRAEALAKRKNLALAKPGGEGAARRLSTISGDGGEYADIIAGLQEKGLV